MGKAKQAQEMRKLHAARFDTIPAGDRTEVVDLVTGHPVGIFDARANAQAEALSLNHAAIAGPKSLAHALGALTDDEYFAGLDDDDGWE